MPEKRKQEQYENAMSSVFDFLFSTSKKHPSKVKPVKASGIDSTSEMVDAITSTLENPLLFVNNETINSFQDAVDINVATFKLGGRAGSDSVKINIKDIGNILRDPAGWVDKKYKTLEGIRKSQRAAWAGEELTGIIAGVWARSSGLDRETQLAMSGAGRISSGARSIGADSEYMALKNEKMAEQYLAGDVPVLDSSHFQDRYGRTKLADDMKDKYLLYRKKYKEASGDMSELSGMFYDSELFTFLEAQNLDRKAQDARLAGDHNRAREYERGSFFVENSFNKSKEKLYRIKQKENLKKYSEAIEKIEKGTGPNKKQKIKDLREKKKEIERDIGYSRLESVAGRLGRAEGAYLSAKSLFYQGDLLPNIINGKFFSPVYNQIEWLQPSETREKFIFNSRVKKDGTVENLGIVFHKAKKKFHTNKDGSYKIKINKKTGEKKEVEKKLQNTYYSMMNAVYYMSPVTWAKSLMTGEIFAYAGHVQRELFEKSAKIFKIPGLDKTGMEALMKDLRNGENGYINSLKSRLSKSQWARLQFFVGTNRFTGALAYVFNTTERVKKGIQNFIDDKVVKNVREQVVKGLLKIVKDEAAKTLLKDWAARGGVKTLVKGGVTAVASALGLAASPIGSALIGAATWVITEFIYQISKPIIKFSLEVGKLGLYGLIGVLFLFISMGSAFVAVFGTHSHVSPHQIIECDAYSPLGLLPVDDEINPGDPDWPGPTGDVPPFTSGNLPPGQQCLFAAGPSLRCTQGPNSYCSKDPNYVNHYRPSHLNSPAIDVAVGGNFNAPTFCNASQGNCKVVATGQGTCGGGYPAGGYVTFTAQHEGRTYQFFILHVAIGVTAGQTLDSGQAVATIVDSADWRMCSSGLHAHLTVKVNGSYVDARAAMNEDFKCNIGECSREQCWPR